MNDIDYIPIAALNHYSFCPHRCWRMFCAAEFVDNQYTVDGTSLHERVHTLSQNDRGEVWQVRAIYLKSEKYNLIGKSDLVEVESGEVYPIEYKRGNKGEWNNDEMQVCAQALCLEEMMGKEIKIGYIYYAQSNQRQLVEINEDLRKQAIATLNLVTNLLQTGIAPPPVYSQKCRGCSLYSQCLPQANKKMQTYQEVA
ncbi:CRISPR-associated protein Cas4 [Merismopedia glauca]|uniref:CRISPR-associated exonuclease Cas4 n=1 Tax=Merismopedia glauca CCAP 1448/3 TaxID=1296344 RepID=A0A2T1BZ01_9CYAN|nr:CRISPR-associated protein Cas4 [Merismopedia glauca]PSB01137.1 CRISPR-associated protein Cas4 [Merismopedia glauca CCAP 1448/3]